MNFQLLKFKSSEFNFYGSLDDSKSIVNRLLIIQSYFKNLKLDFKSDADDVLFLKHALNDLDVGKTEFDIGSGGTSLRFLLGRLSQFSGRYTIKAHPKLLSRPHGDLFQALSQLGTLVLLKDDKTLSVNVKGWGAVSEVYVKSDLSSQFASSLLINSWSLSQPLTINCGHVMASESYLVLTENICRQLGMQFQRTNKGIAIEANQKILSTEVSAEVDASSLFTLSCFALLFGKMGVKPCKNILGQPDFQFLNFFKEWNLKYRMDSEGFEISKQELPHSIELNVQNNPDLFPMLCSLLSFCKGTHRVFGAPNLVNKESDRISKTHELLSLAGIETIKLPDGLAIKGNLKPQLKQFKFNPENDHRMAFSAALFAFAGFSVELSDLSVVSKSFPQFWQTLGLIHDGY